MNDWGETERHLGPAPAAPETPVHTPFEAPGVPRPFESPAGPHPGVSLEPDAAPDTPEAKGPERPEKSEGSERSGSLNAAERERMAVAPPSGAIEEEPLTPADDFDPRYCTMCHTRIPISLSEKQGICNECLRAKHVIASEPPESGVVLPACPRCGSRNVEREWVTDWLSKAVDIVSGITDFVVEGSEYGGYGRYGTYGYHDDTHDEAGTVRVMRHRCLDCGHHWKD